MAALASSVAAAVGWPRTAAPAPAARLAGSMPPTPPADRADRASTVDLSAADAATLVAPFSVGSSIGPWKVERLIPLRRGAAALVLSDEDGVSFQLDLCARDLSRSALRPPASSESFDVYLANGGEGETPSFEHHGLAAMAVAEVIRHNEARLSHAGFLTLRERLTAARESVLEST
jgi:hypothetical protein